MPQTQESTAVDTAAPPSPSNLAPDTGVPLSRSTLIRFGVGFFGISLLWAIGLNAVAAVLLPSASRTSESTTPPPSWARSAP